MNIRLVLFWFAMFTISHGNCQVTFVIDDLVETTPREDTIYLTGTFNNWQTHQSEYALIRQLNGDHLLTLPSVDSSFQYKLTRGSWQKVETDKNNDYINDRIYIPSSQPQIISIRINNWIDLGGARPIISLLFFYYFAIGFIGFISVIVIIKTPKRKVQEAKYLALVMTFTSALLIGRTTYEVAGSFVQSFLGMGLYAFVSLLAPTFYFYFHARNAQQLYQGIWRHFIPSALVLVYVFLRLGNVGLSTTLGLDYVEYLLEYQVFIALGLFQGVFYFVRILKLEKPQLKNWSEQNVFFNSLFVLFSILLILTTFFYFDFWFHTFINPDIFFVLLSFLIVLVIYFALRFPELIKKSSGKHLVVENSIKIKTELEELMIKSKPFINPNLNMSDLSNQLGIKPHVLSKVLNDEVKLNFRDFVNGYRIKEFITFSKKDEFSNYTFLAIAHEVGFNSKSTFNNAFKKATDLSPSQYFKQGNSPGKS
ncbi:MAG: helix-turn-helix domain-containing protein [Reichenbachiella sp.]